MARKNSSGSGYNSFLVLILFVLAVVVVAFTINAVNTGSFDTRSRASEQTLIKGWEFSSVGNTESWVGTPSFKLSANGGFLFAQKSGFPDTNPRIYNTNLGVGGTAPQGIKLLKVKLGVSHTTKPVICTKIQCDPTPTPTPPVIRPFAFSVLYTPKGSSLEKVIGNISGKVDGTLNEYILAFPETGWLQLSSIQIKTPGLLANDTVKIDYIRMFLEVLPTPTPTPTSTPTPTPTPISYKRIFITDFGYQGNFGGLSGADAICQQEANKVNLGGRWEAWLSDRYTSMANRSTHSNLSYRNVNGVIVANNWNDLVDGSLQNEIRVISGYPYAKNPWTNTTSAGAIKETSEFATCNNWTSSSNSYWARLGASYRTNGEWSDFRVENCGQSHELYCLEQ